ncbi:MAG: cation:proton antiporter, partial [Anaerolineales bacterium]|nr:cation:proton antiporter [Anaerolineales bacterium]
MEELAQTILQAERVILLLLIIALVVSVLARRFRWPYTVGLVIIGLGLTFFAPGNVSISPELILGILVPPLLFEAAFHIRVDDLRRDFWLIMLLAIPGVIITTLLVGGVITWGTGMATQTALVFGALIAATDPVAVVALFKQLGVPKRLQILLEGESLFNDGTAIVMFGLMLEISMSGKFDIAESLATFLRVAGGGVLVGVVLGMVASQAIGRIDDALVETAITTILAFGAYVVGEELHVSGVLAVVAAGIVNGNVGPRGMSPTTRIVTKMNRASMPDIQLPEMAGMGESLGSAIGGFDMMPELDEMTIFGGGNSIGNDFVGTFYDFKRSRSGSFISIGRTEFADKLGVFVKKGWRISELARYYRSPK